MGERDLPLLSPGPQPRKAHTMRQICEQTVTQLLFQTSKDLEVMAQSTAMLASVSASAT